MYSYYYVIYHFALKKLYFYAFLVYHLRLVIFSGFGDLYFFQDFNKNLKFYQRRSFIASFIAHCSYLKKNY